MSVIQEVADAITLVSESIENVSKIAEAVQSGIDYLKTNHPEVSADLVLMCRELSKTTSAMASASSVVTQFGFTVAGSDVANQPARFNDYMVKYKSQATEVGQQIEVLRGHCHIVQRHAENMAKDQSGGLLVIARFLGLRDDAKEKELADRLARIWNDEMEVVGVVEVMSSAVSETMRAVQDALGGASMDPARVPLAAAVLEEYAVAFSKLESQCNFVSARLASAIHRIEA